MHHLQINQVGSYAVDIDRVDENSDRGLGKAQWESRHREPDSDRNGTWDIHYFVRS